MNPDRSKLVNARAGAPADALALALTACGGGDGDAVAQPGSAALFDNRGHPAATASTPPAGARQATRAGLYATANQYAQEALASSAYTVLIDVDSLGGERSAVETAMAAHAWERTDPREQQAYFVEATDAAIAVRVADALTASGLAHVFLLTEAEPAMASRPSTLR